MREIPLTRGFVAVVDTHRYDEIAQYKWTVKTSGDRHYAYRQEVFEGKLVQIMMHRQIANPDDASDVDHKNKDTLDNHEENLRICSRSDNLGNTRRHIDKGNDLPKGVTYSRGRRKQYSASVMRHGKRYFLGRFFTVDEAKSAYEFKAKELFGEFASF